MYDYLDRPVVTLTAADRLFLGATRQWVATVRAKRCPCTGLGPALAAQGLLPMLHDLNMAMVLLDREGNDQLMFKPVGCGVLSDDEAMLLTLTAAARAGQDDKVAAIVARIVKPEARHAMTVACHRIAAQLPY